MIKSLELVNFQGHKTSSLTFSPGVNVIKGPSHSGKTSIIRALRWALENKPDGESFKSWFADKSDEVKVAIELDNGFIIRRRDKSFNGYKIPSGELEALRGSVPEEISQLTNMNDVNLQTQHEGYFMLQDSPANALKRLNEIVGLTVIDETLKTANSKIFKYNSDAKHTKTRIEELNEEIESLSYLDFAGKIILKTQEVLQEYDLIGYQIRVLDHLTAEIKKIKWNIYEHGEFLKAEDEYKGCVEIINEMKALRFETTKLARLILEIQEHRKLLEEYDVLLEMNDAVNEMTKLEGDIMNLRSDAIFLKEILHSAEKARKQQNDASLKLAELQKRESDILSKLEICPLCKQRIKKAK